MKIKFLKIKIFNFISCEILAIFLILLFTLSNCTYKSIEKSPQKIIQIDLDSIKYIKIFKNSDLYVIRDIRTIKSIINAIDSSYIEYVKFGCVDFFEIYNEKDSIIFRALYKDKRYKINGIVFTSKYNIFPNTIDSTFYY